MSHKATSGSDVKFVVTDPVAQVSVGAFGVMAPATFIQVDGYGAVRVDDRAYDVKMGVDTIEVPITIQGYGAIADAGLPVMHKCASSSGCFNYGNRELPQLTFELSASLSDFVERGHLTSRCGEPGFVPSTQKISLTVANPSAQPAPGVAGLGQQPKTQAPPITQAVPVSVARTLAVAAVDATTRIALPARICVGTAAEPAKYGGQQVGPTGSVQLQIPTGSAVKITASSAGHQGRSESLTMPLVNHAVSLPLGKGLGGPICP